MNTRWLMIMSRWSRNPPSAKQVKFVFAIIALCVVLVVVEKYIGWPEALTVNRLHR